MVSEEQRRRQLVSAKLERQRARRTAQAQRRRSISIAVGVVVGLIAAAGLVWLIIHLVTAEKSPDPTPQPSGPSDPGLLPPSFPVLPTTGASPVPTEDVPSGDQPSDDSDPSNERPSDATSSDERPSNATASSGQPTGATS